MRRRLRLFAILTGVVLGTPVVFAQGAAPTTDDCQACHAEPSMTRANGQPVVVPPQAFAQSVHSVLSCVDCHTDLAKVTEFPHPEQLAPVDCATCHDAPAAGFAKSVHAAVKTPEGAVVSCVSCHGPPHEIKPSADPASATNKLNVVTTCVRCHGDTVARGTPRGPAVAGVFADSIHGLALTRTTVAPACADCHRAHDIRRNTDAESPVHPPNVPATCGMCHMQQRRLYDEGVHAAALKQGGGSAPQCASCHTAHSIRPTTGDDWQLAAVEECGTCHREALTSYRDSFHGQVTALGFTPVAKCADCHRSHDVLPRSDPRSSIAPQNVEATCRACHPSANANFAKFQPHANKNDPERSPELYHAARFMNALFVGVFAFFGAHTLLWFARERSDGTNRAGGRRG